MDEFSQFLNEFEDEVLDESKKKEASVEVKKAKKDRPVTEKKVVDGKRMRKKVNVIKLNWVGIGKPPKENLVFQDLFSKGRDPSHTFREAIPTQIKDFLWNHKWRPPLSPFYEVPIYFIFTIDGFPKSVLQNFAKCCELLQDTRRRFHAHRIMS